MTVSWVVPPFQEAVRPAPEKVASAFSLLANEVPLPAVMPVRLEVFSTPATSMRNVIVALTLAVVTLKTAVEGTASPVV